MNHAKTCIRLGCMSSDNQIAAFSVTDAKPSSQIERHLTV